MTPEQKKQYWLEYTKVYNQSAVIQKPATNSIMLPTTNLAIDISN